MPRRKKILLTLILSLVLFFTQVSNTYTYATNDLENLIHSEEKGTVVSVYEAVTFLTPGSSKEASSREELKNVIYKEILNRNTIIKIQYYGEVGSSEAFKNMLQDVIDELLEFDNYAMYTFTSMNSKADYSYLQNPDGSEGKIQKPIDVTITASYRTTLEQENYVASRTNEILNQIIEDGMSDEDKVKAVHNYIVSNVEYDTSLSRFTAYDALYEGKAVCQGYSLLGYKMLNDIGIPTRIISSAQMNHSWNLVRVNGQWYHMDMTWDDPTPDVKGRVLEDHLLLTDAQIIELDKNQDPPRSWESSEYPSLGEGIVGSWNGGEVNQVEVPDESEELKEFEQIAEIINEMDTGSETMKVKITADPGVIEEGARFDIKLLDNNDEEIRRLIMDSFNEQDGRFEDLMIYNISLKKDDASVSIDGRVLISISTPENFQQDKLIKVFKVNKDGIKKDMKAQIIDDNIEFITAYSGTYVITILTEDNKFVTDDNDDAAIEIDAKTIDELDEKAEDMIDKVEDSEENGFLDGNKKKIQIILILSIFLMVFVIIIKIISKKRKKFQRKDHNSHLDIYYNNGYKNFDED